MTIFNVTLNSYRASKINYHIEVKKIADLCENKPLEFKLKVDDKLTTNRDVMFSSSLLTGCFYSTARLLEVS